MSFRILKRMRRRPCWQHLWMSSHIVCGNERVPELNVWSPKRHTLKEIIVIPQKTREVIFFYKGMQDTFLIDFVYVVTHLSGLHFDHIHFLFSIPCCSQKPLWTLGGIEKSLPSCFSRHSKFLPCSCQCKLSSVCEYQLCKHCATMLIHGGCCWWSLSGLLSFLFCWGALRVFFQHC